MIPFRVFLLDVLCYWIRPDALCVWKFQSNYSRGGSNLILIYYWWVYFVCKIYIYKVRHVEILLHI